MVNADPFNCFVIDDVGSVRTLIASFLTSRGHNVFCFSSAEEAWERLDECQPDLIFLDWILPQMSGREFCERLHARPAPFHPLVIMVTSKADSLSLGEALDSGADDYIQKPFTLPHLAVRTTIAERQVRERHNLKASQVALQEHQSYLNALSSSIAAGIVIVDHGTHLVLECNPYAVELFGYSRADIVGQYWDRYCAPAADPLAQPCAASTEDPSRNRRQVQLLTATGERPVLLSSQVVTYGGREVLLATFVDISELVLAQAELKKYAQGLEELAADRARQLVHADRLAILGVMSAGIAHEMGNCITLIAPNADMVERYVEALIAQLPPEIRNSGKNPLMFKDLAECLVSIRHGALRTYALLKNLKNHARRDQGDRVPCQFRQCLDNALMLCHNNLKYGIQLTIEVPDDLPQFLAVPQQIEQVLVNLINNATQAMEGKGQLRIAAAWAGENISICVEDNGPGVAEDALQKIWEPFFTTKPRDIGTGLGLSICKGIVEDLQGTIKAGRSALGGAAFVLRIPLAPNTPNPVAGGAANRGQSYPAAPETDRHSR